MQLTRLNLSQILFLDIETVPLYAQYSELSEQEKELWDEKTRYQRQDISCEEFYERAGILAEFGKIVCISVGYFYFKKENRQFRLRSFVGKEHQILQDFSNLLNDHFSYPNQLLCAHNGKEFDFPFISRRLLINGLPLPNILNLFGKKPWEVRHLDTLELWKFGDYKHYTSLKLLSYVLGIPSPKDDITGKEVAEVFYRDKDINRIREYCQRDVVAVAQIFLRLRRESLLTEQEIVYVE